MLLIINIFQSSMTSRAGRAGPKKVGPFPSLEQINGEIVFYFLIQNFTIETTLQGTTTKLANQLCTKCVPKMYLKSKSIFKN